MIKKIPAIIDDLIIRPLASYKFDQTYNINTRGEIGHELLDAQDQQSLAAATYYQAVPMAYLDIVFELLADDTLERHFVDLGCGKGRACFYACQKYQRVTGIDFSPSLIATAKQNLQSFSGTIKGQVQFVLQDAAMFDLPDEPALVYLYNPFDERILKKFLTRNMRHFFKHNSIIVYVNDICHDLLIQHGFARVIKYQARKGISIYWWHQ